MVHPCLRTCLSLASAALVQAESPDSLTLVQDGVARASIVLSADADETEKLAAEELNAYLHKATGTSLPLADAQAEILVGVRDPDLRRELGLATLAFDGSVIDCDEKRLVLAGNVPEGTLNAAAGAFGTYDYTGLTWMLPRVYPHAMAESLRFYADVGAVAVTNEAYPTWWYAAPQLYLRTLAGGMVRATFACAAGHSIALHTRAYLLAKGQFE